MTTPIAPKARTPIFIYLLVSTGFALGTFLLLGPVRWITNILRSNGSSDTIEQVVIYATIAILLVVSLVTAHTLNQKAASSHNRNKLLLMLCVPGALALGAVALWMNPNLIVQRTFQSGPPQHFFIGPYPQEADLARIKENGYTAVISLLHPAIVPFEPKLIRDERIAAKRAGIKLIEIPMLPWVSKNVEALAELRALAADTSARYYLHCYLGKDRVNVVRRALARVNVKVGGTAAQAARSLDSITVFERGTVERLADGVYLTPYPSDEEYFGYVVAGGVKTVVSLLDPTNPEDSLWVGKERKRAGEQGIKLISRPASSRDAKWATALATELSTFPRPIVVHGFRNPSPPTTALKEALTKVQPPRTAPAR